VRIYAFSRFAYIRAYAYAPTQLILELDFEFFRNHFLVSNKKSNTVFENRNSQITKIATTLLDILFCSGNMSAAQLTAQELTD
jgi:hypothetical protein